jgi:glycosyltransferase involved in cell wall biosynthesis
VTRRRVTVVAHELRGFVPSGGMGTATTFLALALARLGHSVEILLGINAPEAMDPQWAAAYARAGVHIRAAPPPDERVEPWHFMHARSIELGLREEPPDVVVTPDFGAPAYTALSAREAGLAFDDTLFVVFCHGPWRYALDLSPRLAPPDLRHVLAFGIHEQASVELADVVVSPSTYLLDWMRGRGWRLPERALVVPHFTPATATGEPLANADRGDGRLARLAFFGRLDERKGLKVFAAGLNAVEPQLLDGIELEFVGRTTATWPRESVEALLSDRTRRALRDVSFWTQLDQPEALARLARPGTLAVMPSLQENSPYAVYECLELRIPFLASKVGGVPELIAADDHDRVLFEPSADGVEAALTNVLAARQVPPPPRPAFTSADSSDRWSEVIEMRPRRRAHAPSGPVDVVIVRRGSEEALSRCLAALERQTYRDFQVAGVHDGEAVGSAPFVLFLADEHVVDADLLGTLVQAQAASDADVVSCAVRRVGEERETLHFFSGDPGGLGLLSNGYGTVALVRRSVLRAGGSLRDGDWPFLARLAASGARILAVPVPLVTQSDGIGTVEHDSHDALLVAQQLERALPDPLRGTVRLAAGLAADTPPARAAQPRPTIPLAIVVLTLLAAAARFSTLGRQSYWYDELATVSVLHHSFGGTLHAVARSEATPYLYYLLAWPWTRLFGFGEAGLRSLSALAGTLTVPLTYAAGATLVSRRVGIVAAALVAANPFLVWYSQEARAYALFALFAASTVYLFARALRGEPRSLAGWAVAASLAVATHYFAVFIVGAEAVWLAVRQRRRALLAAVLPAAVLVAEVPLIVRQRHNGGNLGASPLLHRVVGIPKDLVVGYSFPAELAGTLAAALLLSLGLALAIRATTRGWRNALVAAGIAATSLVAPIVVALFGADYVIARNMIAVVVPAAIFLAAGYAARRVGIAAAVLLCALSLAIVGAVAADTGYGRTDWRGAAKQLRPGSRPRAIVVTPTIDPRLWRPYLSGLREPATSTIRAQEVVVLGLATQGGFSTQAVHPPSTPPRPAPGGFHLVSTKRTPTYVIVRYRSSNARPVARTELAALGLSSEPATVFLQGAGPPPR